MIDNNVAKASRARQWREMPIISTDRMTPTRTTTPRLPKADRKKQLLAHAKRLFVDLGFQHTTTEKIAHAAGVSEPVLYRHFDSKKALFLEVLQEVRQSDAARSFAEETGKIADPLEQLRVIIDLYLGSTREHALEFRVMHRTLVETDDPEIAEFLRSFYRDNENYLALVIKSVGQDINRASSATGSSTRASAPGNSSAPRSVIR